MSEYVSDVCEIICENNDKKMMVDVLSFQAQKYLSVSIQKSLKLEMKWTGKRFEGKLSSLAFSSNGPSVQYIKEGR